MIMVQQVLHLPCGAILSSLTLILDTNIVIVNEKLYLNSNMQEKDKSIKKHWDRLITALDELGKSKWFTILVSGVTILVLTAGEPIRIVCRKNQGRHEISYIRLALSLLEIILCGALFIIFKGSFADFFFYKTFAATNLAMIITGTVYILSGISVFAIGMAVKANAEKNTFFIDNPEYPGDSILFADKNLAKVRNFYEPLTFLIIGLLLSLLHPLIGAPLIACAIFYWICLIVEEALKIEEKRRKAILQRHTILRGPIMEILKPYARKKNLFKIRVSFFKA